MISEHRWNSLIVRLCGHPPLAEVFRQLTRAYGEPHRSYHNLDHIAHVLHELDAAAAWRKTRMPWNSPSGCTMRSTIHGRQTMKRRARCGR
jgi:predicted metal-dependent HD superfamily phosphohydrolase